MPRRSTHNYYADIEKQRTAEAERSQHALKSRMRSNWESQAGLDERATRKRYRKRFDDLRQESEMVLEMERKAAQRKAEQEAREAEEEQNRLKEAANQQEKLREALFKRIVEQSTDIQSLEGELRKKLLKKEQIDQISNLENRRAEQLEAEKNRDVHNIGMPQFELREKEQERKRVEANLKMKETLERQLIDKARREAEEASKVEQERLAVEAVVKAIEIDEMNRAKREEAKREELQESIREYKKLIAREQRERKAREADAEAAILRYRREKEAREAELERMKEEERAERARRTAKVAAIAGKEKEEADRMSELIVRLHQARMEQKRIEEEQKKAEKHKEELRELKQGRLEQRRYKEKLRVEAERKEREFEAQMRARFDAGERQELEKAELKEKQKVQMKTWYDSYFEAQPDPMKVKRAEWQAQRDEEERKANVKLAVVDDARKRLFSEYAEHLPLTDLLSLAQSEDERLHIQQLYSR